MKLDRYSFVRDFASGQILRKEEMRTKIISLRSTGYFVYQLSNVNEIASVSITCDEGEAMLTENGRSLMNLTERIHVGHH